MYDNSYNKTYTRLENREIARNIKKGAIKIAEEQKKALEQRNKDIESQETLKNNIFSSLCLFQFHYGLIGTCYHLYIYPLLLRFNSIMVYLVQ